MMSTKEHDELIQRLAGLLSDLPGRFFEELTAQGGAALGDLLCRAIGTSTDHRHPRGSPPVQRECAEEAYDRAWERLHVGSWRSIQGIWRRAFGYAAVLKAQWQLRDGDLDGALRTLDMGLMMAGPMAAPGTHAAVDAVHAALVSKRHVTAPDTREPAVKRQRQDPSTPGTAPNLMSPVERVHMPSLEDFHKRFMLTNTPVIITGVMDHWPALGRLGGSCRSWKDLDYIKELAGFRTVPIEVGSSYLEDDWGQRLMTLNEFIDGYLVPAEQPRAIGYLAQHHLFDQIPALGRGIITPDYCTIPRNDDDDTGDEDISVNAWFGPKGTVSPLHFDPKDNLLCQVVGEKYLRLYAPCESSRLYAVDGMLSNTSQVNAEDPDLEAFPEFEHAQFTDCVLKEGEMLYIPPTHWHYVRSLSVSFSVSFWWT